MAEISRVLSILHFTCRSDVWRWKYFFIKISKNSLFGNWSKNFVIYLPNLSWNDCQKCVVPFLINTFNEVIFSKKRSFSFFWVFIGKTHAGLSKQQSTLTEEQMSKAVFYFEWFDLWYYHLTLNKTFWILIEIIKQGCQYCNLRVEMLNIRRNIFFSNKQSISIYFSFLRNKSLDIQRKQIIRTYRNAFNVFGGKLERKNVLFSKRYNFTHLFGLWR